MTTDLSLVTKYWKWVQNFQILHPSHCNFFPFVLANISLQQFYQSLKNMKLGFSFFKYQDISSLLIQFLFTFAFQFAQGIKIFLAILPIWAHAAICLHGYH